MTRYFTEDHEWIEVDGDSAFVPVHCNQCNSQWNEVYKFVGIEDFVEG